MGTEKYTIEELAERTGFTRRTIRYYIHEGLVDPPAGRGRGGFYYDSHLQRLLQVRTYQEQGIGLSAMVSLLRNEPPEEPMLSREVIIRYEIVPGIELCVTRDMEVSQPKKIREIIRIAKAIAQGKVRNEE